MNIDEITAAKRDGKILTERAIDHLVALTSTSPDDAAFAALLMAIYINGLSLEETTFLTNSMANSGHRLFFDEGAIDKHSTGGVGDKTSLVIAPLLAAAGHPVPMISGRSLGHTGGTLDKLDAIPGFKSALSTDDLRAVLDSAGCFIAAATSSLAPADAYLYALRDRSSTVPSIPLITSSILSKKIASGAKHLVLDVKVGSGGFSPTLPDALALATSLTEVAAALHMPTVSLLTRMDIPLGHAVGNAVEVQEAIDILSGIGDPILRSLCIDLAHAVLAESGDATTKESLSHLLDSGLAREHFEHFVHAQGGRLDLPTPEYTTVVKAENSGRVYYDAGSLARVSSALGATRAVHPEVDHTASIRILAPSGVEVAPGEGLLELGCADPFSLDAAITLCSTAVRFDTIHGPPQLSWPTPDNTVLATVCPNSTHSH